MAIEKSTAGVVLRSKPVPAVIRGRLHHVVGPVAFAEFRRAVCAWSAAEAERVSAVELQQLKQDGGAR